jgi:hypothetical protein
VLRSPTITTYTIITQTKRPLLLFLFIITYYYIILYFISGTFYPSQQHKIKEWKQDDVNHDNILREEV